MNINCLRILSLILAAFMLISVVACSQNIEDTPGGNDSVDATTQGEETEEEISSAVPKKDLEGYDYRILSFYDDYIATIFSDTMNGSLVNDAVYEKIQTVGEYLNVKIRLADGTDHNGDSPDDCEKVVRKEILSGLDTFDIVQGHDITMGNLSLEGYFVNLYNVPYLDFTKPWWPADSIESLTVMDQMYLMSNNIAYFQLGETRMLFFNKGLLKDLNIEYPYNEVYNGTWTLDTLNSYAKKGYKDINGNSQVDSDDTFGFINGNRYYCWLEPFKVEPYVKEENGELYYNFDLEKIQTIVEKFYQLLFSGYGLNIDDADKLFSYGKAMFVYTVMRNAVNIFSSSEISYGILPMPKLYETDDYYGGCTDRPLAIPITATNLEETGIVTEALNFAGYKIVFPAYYEVALKHRYADQTDDAKMIDIVHNNVIMSFTYIYGNYSSPYNNLFGTLFDAKKPSTDVASYAKRNEKGQIKRVNEIMSFFEKQANQ